MKNIFYCSNAHEDIFGNNTRSNFNSYFDIHHLNYLHDNDIEAAIKSITYDDKTSIRIQKKNMKPNIVIKHEIDSSTIDIMKSYFKDHHSDISTEPNLSKSVDHGILNDEENYSPFYEQESRNSNFCNLQMITSSYVMHNIFLHDSVIFSENELIHYLNNILKSISLSSTRLTKIDKDLLHKRKSGATYLKSDKYDIFIESELGNILNLPDIRVKAHYGNSLRKLFCWEKPKTKIHKLRVSYIDDEGEELLNEFSRSNITNNYINTLFNHKQELQYFKVRKRMKSRKLNLKMFQNETLYGIKTNISDPIVWNGEYDDIITLFVGNKTNDVVHVDFKNPSFFPTRKELLSKASFQIIDVATNSAPYFAIGSPTYIQVVVRKRIMGKNFNIFLDSSCKKSKKMYPENNSTTFTIELPERLNFNKHWQVTLKSLFLPNNIQNVPNCWMICNQATEGKGKMYMDGYKVLHSVKLILKEGKYPSIESVLDDLSEQIIKAQLPIKIQLHEGKVKISCDTFIQSETFLEIVMSDDLASILGYSKPLNKFQGIKLYEYQDNVAKYEYDVFVKYPKNLIIGCDVVDNTIFGGEHVKLLKMVTNSLHSSSNILTFEFLQNEYVDLNVREFRSIQIAIMDATGNPVKTDSSIPTRLQLMFNTV